MNNNIFQPDIFRGLLCFFGQVRCGLPAHTFFGSGTRGDKALAILGGTMAVGAALAMGLQQTTFGRAYAAYAGMLALMALLWGWHADKIRPDRFEAIGALAVLIGTAILFFMPRK